MSTKNGSQNVSLADDHYIPARKKTTTPMLPPFVGRNDQRP